MHATDKWLDVNPIGCQYGVCVVQGLGQFKSSSIILSHMLGWPSILVAEQCHDTCSVWLAAGFGLVHLYFTPVVHLHFLICIWHVVTFVS